MRRAALLLACLSVLAGCMERTGDPARPEGPDPMTTSSSQSQSGGPGDAGDGPVAFPSPVHLTECRGFWTGIFYPDGTVPARQDPSWDPPFPFPLTQVDIEVYDCARVAIGPFERPLRILTEVHGNLNTPDSCRPEVGPNEVSTNWILSIWVNDAEVAAWMRDVFGMPAHYSAIEETSQQDPAFLERTWTWGLEGQESSALTVFDDSPEYTPSTNDARYFWFNETAVSFADVHREFISPNFHRPIKGRLAPPMLGSSFSPDYASEVMMMSETTVDMEVMRYRDHFCTEPA